MSAAVRETGERRAFLRSACRHCLAAGSLLGLRALAAEPGGSTLPPRFARPVTDSDEGGLWGLMDREEGRLRRSPLVIKAPALNTYLTGLACRLAEGHCPDIRVHVLRMPLFNAAMAPNGMMLVWSGLLLRVENEAQLAAIIGHELGHYLERHQLEQLRAAKDRAVLAQLAGLLGGVAGAVGRVGLLATGFAFSREHEDRADRLGMRLLQQAGYDGGEAARVWENLLAEMKVTGGQEAGKRDDLFTTHPATAGRRDALRALAGSRGGRKGEVEYRQAIAPLRLEWIEDEIHRGQYEESLVLFDRLLAASAADADLRYARGEVLRLRDEPGDAERAMADLAQASAAARAPARAFRALGLIHQQQQRRPEALRAFEQYLAREPAAPDAGLVSSYVEELRT